MNRAWLSSRFSRKRLVPSRAVIVSFPQKTKMAPDPGNITQKQKTRRNLAQEVFPCLLKWFWCPGGWRIWSILTPSIPKYRDASWLGEALKDGMRWLAKGQSCDQRECCFWMRTEYSFTNLWRQILSVKSKQMVLYFHKNYCNPNVNREKYISSTHSLGDSPSRIPHFEGTTYRFTPGWSREVCGAVG